MSFVDIDAISRTFTKYRLFGEHTHVHALQKVSLVIHQGETYALAGESGSGKSTLARIIVGLDSPTHGQVFIGDNPVSTHMPKAQRRDIQMIFQSPYASLNQRWRVKDIVAEPLHAFKLTKGKKATQYRVDELLEQVGLSAEDAGKYPHQFSGGQRQRISIARALSANPKFIVCDEPTSALDVSVQAQVLNLLKLLQKELGLTYLFITHDLAVVKTMAHRVGILKQGELVEEQSTEALFAKPQHAYTKSLLAAAPVLRIN